MLNKNIIKGGALVVAIALVGGTSSVLAANDSNFKLWKKNQPQSSLNINQRPAYQGNMGLALGKIKPANFSQLSTAEKEAAREKMEAVRNTLESANYQEWVKAVKALNPNAPQLQTVTATNFQDYVNRFQVNNETRDLRLTNMEALRTAINNNDYEAWKAAVKKINPDSPLLSKITAENFSRLVAAHKAGTPAEKQAILKELGLEQGQGLKAGPGHDQKMKTQRN